MPAPKVTEADEELILELRVDPETRDRRGCRAISRILAEKHGRVIHFTQVARILKARREERQEIAQEVTRDRLQHSLTRDLDTLDEVLQTELEVWRAAKPKINESDDGPVIDTQSDAPLKDWRGLGQEIRETLTLRMKLSGAGPQSGTADDLTNMTDEQLAAELEQARRVAASAPSGTPE
jgi:hypothetical protein